MDNFINDSKVFKALCDENRLYILDLMKNGEICVCKLIEITNIKQSRLSYHMKILVDSGVVNLRSEGKWNYYSINDNSRNNVISLLKKYLK